MPTISDIRSDKYQTWFDDFPALTLLVYQELDGPSPVISISDADLLSVIQVFNNITACQNCVSENFGKIITLFGYDGNIQQWLRGCRILPNNLESVKIFCFSDDWFFVTSLIENYRKRFTNVDFNIIAFEDLNHELLSYTLKYLKVLRIRFKNSPIIYELDYDYEQIRRTLENHGRERANMEDQKLEQGEQPQD